MAQLDVSSILGPGGVIAHSLGGFEVRPQQLRMAEAVAQVIEEAARAGDDDVDATAQLVYLGR